MIRKNIVLSDIQSEWIKQKSKGVLCMVTFIHELLGKRLITMEVKKLILRIQPPSLVKHSAYTERVR